VTSAVRPGESSEEKTRSNRQFLSAALYVSMAKATSTMHLGPLLSMGLQEGITYEPEESMGRNHLFDHCCNFAEPTFTPAGRLTPTFLAT
jgi:hypothetical protein